MNKKISICLMVLVAAVVAVALMRSKPSVAPPIRSLIHGQPSADGGAEVPTQGPQERGSHLPSASGINADLMPASRVFPDAGAAVDAVLRAIDEHNDLLIEQFRAPGRDCRWCEEFYAALRNLLSRPTVTRDQIRFIGEILATSERPENVKFLFGQISQVSDPSQIESFADASELVCGGAEIAKILADQLDSSSQRVREAAVVALTNQGSRQAAEVLYERTMKNGEGARYAALGIGLGEMVPDDEAIPYLTEIAARHDQNSSFAIYALLNAGLQGLRQVFAIFSESSDPDAQRGVFDDALGHVLLDKETESYVREQEQKSSDPIVHDFAKKILERFNAEPPAELDGEEDEVSLEQKPGDK